jgi:hypothetical protein
MNVTTDPIFIQVVKKNFVNLHFFCNNYIIILNDLHEYYNRSNIYSNPTK